MIAKRDQMIAAAAALLPSRGLHGLTMIEAARVSGAPRGSLYHYFPGGKEELAVAAVAFAGRVGERLITRAATKATSPDAFAQALGKSLEQWIKSSGMSGGCPVTAASIGCTAKDRKIADACRSAFSAWRTAIERALTGFGFENSPGVAGQVLITFEGGLLLAQATQSLEHIESAVSAVRGLLKA